MPSSNLRDTTFDVLVTEYTAHGKRAELLSYDLATVAFLILERNYV
jgi:hypothetical protein